MRTTARMGAIAIAAAMWAATSGAQLPPEVAERLEQLVVPEDGDEFFGSYRMRASSVVAKPDGDQRKATEIEMTVERLPDAPESRHLLRFFENGVDATAAHRDEIEGRAHRGREEDDDGGGNLALPVGEQADSYRFSTPRAVDGHLEVDFQPGPTVAEDEAVRGTIAWDGSSSRPLWVELVPVDPPSPVRELQVRMETAEVEGRLVVTRMVTSGRVRILLMKRDFTTDVRFTDVSFAVPATAD